MDWSNERYYRRYVRETVADVALHWKARAIWDAIMLKLDRAGVIDLQGYGLLGLAGLIRIPADEVIEHMPALLADGRCELHGEYLVAPNWIPAQEANQSDRQRQAESRARRRDLARRAEVLASSSEASYDQNVECGLQSVSEEQSGENESSNEQNVTNRDSMSQNVNKCHTRSHGVTPSLSSLSSLDPPLPPTGGDGSLFGPLSEPPEEPRGEPEESPAPSRPRARKPRAKVNGWTPALREAATVAEPALKRLSERTKVGFGACVSNVRWVERLLREESPPTERDLRLVVWHYCNEWLGTPQAKYLQPSTLFGVEKFAERLAQSKAAWAKKHGDEDESDAEVSDVTRAFLQLGVKHD